MRALSELQAAFGRAVLAGGDAPVEPDLEQAIAGDGLPVEARLAIYRHHVADTLTRVLEAAYPVVCRLVHERFFAYAASRYIAAHPPAGPCLAEYGESFPHFLHAFGPCRHLPYLADVARLEWALHRAEHAPDEAAVDPAELAALGPDEIAATALRLHPSISLLASPWPIDRIWQAGQPDADPDRTVDLDGGGARLEVRRDGDRVLFRGLGAAVFALVERLAAGHTLAAAAAAAAGIDPALDLAAALRELFAGGGVTGFTITREPMEDET